MSTYIYAAYGSNLHPLRLVRRTPSARHLGSAWSGDWDMRFHKKSDVDGSGKCTISRGIGGVHFSVYEIAQSEKHLLDAIEGLRIGYDELTVSLPEYGDCQTYIALDHVIDSALAPMDWYKELVLLGCRANGFPDSYRRRIEAISPIIDPDEERRREQWQLIDAITNGSGM